MPKILSVGTAVPKYEITQDTAKQFSRSLFKDRFRDIERLLRSFDHTMIDKRYFCVPIEWFEEDHTFEEKNLIYTTNALQLSKEAILSCLQPTPYTTKEIDHIFFVSSTGLSTPSIDAYLFNEPDIDFSPTIKRTPIWGLGCAGGAAGLSRALDYTRAYPESKVLVVAVEIGELAFLRNDQSKSNLIATSLFGDGAAAVLVVGDENNHLRDISDNHVSILDSQSVIWKHSLDIMGWDVRNEGLKVIFSRSIPTLVENDLKRPVEEFLQKQNLTLADLDFYVLHPGGTKVIEAYEKTFEIHEDDTRLSRRVLADYGNMSSPTVLFVLQQWLKEQPVTRGYGLLLAMGPGFSAEMLLLKSE